MSDYQSHTLTDRIFVVMFLALFSIGIITGRDKVTRENLRRAILCLGGGALLIAIAVYDYHRHSNLVGIPTLIQFLALTLTRPLYNASHLLADGYILFVFGLEMCIAIAWNSVRPAQRSAEYPLVPKVGQRSTALSIFLPSDAGRPIREYVPIPRPTPYYIERYMFAFLPIGLIYVLYKSWMTRDPDLFSSTMAIEACVFIVIALMFQFARKYRVYAVGIFEDGISIYRFLEYRFIRWTDIVSFRPSDGLYGRYIGVLKTATIAVHLPMHMKDDTAKDPTIKAGLTRGHWVDQDGTTREVTFENSPLYREIVPKLRQGAANQAL